MSIICTDRHPLILRRKPELRHRRSTNALFPQRMSCQCWTSASTKWMPLISSPTKFLHQYAGTLDVRASGSSAVVECISDDACFFEEIFPVTRTETVEGKMFVKLEADKNEEIWHLTIGCSLPGKWVLHWGVNFVDDAESEWDQPPKSMWPPGSVGVMDYAVETPLMKFSEKDAFHEVKIALDSGCDIAAINFVLKDEESGAWYQHKSRDFKVALVDDLLDDDNVIGPKKGTQSWPGALLSNMMLKAETPPMDSDGTGSAKESRKEHKLVQGFYEEKNVAKHVVIENSVSVTVQKSSETAKTYIHLETDLPGDVVVHWGVCRDESRRWEIPPGPYPRETTVFKNKALRTVLKEKSGEDRRSVDVTLDEEAKGFLFVFKHKENTWLKCNGNDFFIPLVPLQKLSSYTGPENSGSLYMNDKLSEVNQRGSPSVYTDNVISDTRNIVIDISVEKSLTTISKGMTEHVFQEIEKYATEAYNIFRKNFFPFGDTVVETEIKQIPSSITSGTGTGYEVLLQAFNWESNKSGKWYLELKERASEIAALGFSVIWLPPPTESVSPEGYMPKDLYNLNSRYGTAEELKDLVQSLHDVGLKVLGDVVLNHRCAHSQNQNGIWNVFGGRLNWDDRAIVGDDPHFQGRGNKSSGDNFHAAPNIDHSQEFVRNDLKEWLNWLREEFGYDGWRLDFVRGFWGGYVKDYMESSEPYFAVGEYWDSLSYTYNEMDYIQDAHRQRIIDWINATSGTAGAFDVTTKGILHAALDRCEYWRLTDSKGKAPGVVGWWPSRAVTFIENHDTGSTQGHWRFPGGKEMQGYAYILTHPGTPAVFYDHIFSHYQSEISSLISIRLRNKIHCRSLVKITKAEREVYAAIVDDKVAMKIGPGYYEPPSGSHSWSLALEGRDYKVWEAA